MSKNNLFKERKKMKNRFLSILLATIMLASIFALTSCDTIFESLFGSNGTHEHEWSEWETIKSADCKNSGTAERFCDCGETQTKSLPVSEHNSSGWIVDNEATCQVEGSNFLTSLKQEPSNYKATFDFNYKDTLFAIILALNFINIIVKFINHFRRRH